MLRWSVVAAVLVAAGLASAPAATALAPFPNCTDARAAGYEDIPSDSPYYGPWLDKDDDGVGCES
ncbi:MAG: excalibur calcium-binding domain-containing protein [Mycobacterium sp.]|nr:excalibur calcium-binding domain-containing protein [Mycobacterium sp.]